MSNLLEISIHPSGSMRLFGFKPTTQSKHLIALKFFLKRKFHDSSGTMHNFKYYVKFIYDYTQNILALNLLF
ncbi:hypothetical protein BpHYR1_021553 [Brachionus plicatilis]|uniref:Uncharacterized protein n=1 Tax=Brachionus plicatilis TaxID=10195 RepID=A0A3M7SY00_BRAPC|nr:hypothetical protein BpHYR1_021553 [Brachionus plicatilis]